MSAPSIPDAMAIATSHGTWFVTRRQLWLAWSGATRALLWQVWAPVALIPLLYMAGAASWGFVGPLVIGGVLGFLTWSAWSGFVPDEATFDRMLSTHIRRFGAPDRLLLEPGLHTRPQPAVEDDVHTHGAAGIIVVDDDLLVDLLVRNNVHATLGMVVVSMTGYPDYVVETLQPLARDTSLYLLHGSRTSYDTLVAACRDLFPSRVGAPTSDLGVEGVTAWIGRGPGLTRDPHVTPDSLRMAQLLTLLQRATRDGSTLRSALLAMRAEERRTRGRSSYGDSHGWG